MFRKYLLIYIISWLEMYEGVVGGPQERRLINDLMANYNKLERPVNYDICILSYVLEIYS